MAKQSREAQMKAHEKAESPEKENIEEAAWRKSKRGKTRKAGRGAGRK
jgi:hypothetical protein